MARLDGAKVVVIGGASGVGFAVAAAALEAGAEVVVGSSQAPRVEAAARKLDRGARGRTVDVRDEDSVAAVFDAAGPFDHLVFTAGDWVHMFGPTRDLDVEARKARMEVRFWGAARAAKHALNQIAKDDQPDGRDAGAPAHAGRAAGHRLGPHDRGPRHGPRAPSCADPGQRGVLGLILSEYAQAMGEATIKGFTANLPLPRGSAVEDAPEAYLYLMRATYVTGQVLRVDGGGSLV